MKNAHNSIFSIKFYWKVPVFIFITWCVQLAIWNLRTKWIPGQGNWQRKCNTNSNPHFHCNDHLFVFSTTLTEISKNDSSHCVKNVWKQLKSSSNCQVDRTLQVIMSLASPGCTGIPSPSVKIKIKIITLGRSVHSGQLSNLGWKLRTLGPISWFHFCCSQNPSPSSSTWWTEDLGGSILISLKPATRSRKNQTPWYGFKQEHTVHLCKQLNQQSKT